ncbi:MAG: ABC transporter permease [Nitrospinae bacterium]|nr:ABC transporter permease [Nitrospinota bacterium]
MIHLIPGDPVETMMGESARAADKQEMRHALGLDRPLPEQYVAYIAGLARGDMGISLRTHEPVFLEIVSRWPATISLALAALLIAAVVAIPMGVLAAARRGSALDKGSLVISLVGVAVPNIWLGPMLIIAFSLWLGWFPVSGRGEPLSIVLPAVTLGAGMAALLARLTRSSVLEAAGEEYMKAARARGLSERQVWMRHALANALLPVATVMGLQLGALLSGAVITETIFAWPGVGRLLIDAIESRDYPLVQGCVLNIALCYVAVNFAVDALYAVLDPRIRVER